MKNEERGVEKALKRKGETKEGRAGLGVITERVKVKGNGRTSHGGQASRLVGNPASRDDSRTGTRTRGKPMLMDGWKVPEIPKAKERNKEIRHRPTHSEPITDAILVARTYLSIFIWNLGDEDCSGGDGDKETASDPDAR